MPGAQNASRSNEPVAEDGKMHMTKCDSIGNDGNPCPKWTHKNGIQLQIMSDSKKSHFC